MCLLETSIWAVLYVCFSRENDRKTVFFEKKAQMCYYIKDVRPASLLKNS